MFEYTGQFCLGSGGRRGGKDIRSLTQFGEEGREGGLAPRNTVKHYSVSAVELGRAFLTSISFSLLFRTGFSVVV